MTKQAAISEGLCQWLDGSDLESKQYEAMMLLSVTEDGWPNTAMLSVGEVLALDRSRLRLALWQGTVTTGNLLRTEQGTLVAIHDGAAHYVRLRLQALPDLPDARHPLQRFDAEVVAVREDIAKYADIISAVKFQLHDPDEVLQRWKETLEELRK
ncbi:pyridoxamine 5'-phosphate oxidase family protein [Paenibacillus lautus]|uniref:pyridoxamine 5'-phosphate oxidase family protein n=1 Tax=Paenibacillus lautus TaxID=1401 RepID=UPI000FDB83E4|nr:pyridoxamine 5'-phosphate oxidase family protein [Paenibacillus lautus]